MLFLQYVRKAGVISSLEIKNKSEINVAKKEKPGQKICGFKCLVKRDEKDSYVTHQLRSIFPSVYTNIDSDAYTVTAVMHTNSQKFA